MHPIRRKQRNDKIKNKNKQNIKQTTQPNTKQRQNKGKSNQQTNRIQKHQQTIRTTCGLSKHVFVLLSVI